MYPSRLLLTLLPLALWVATSAQCTITMNFNGMGCGATSSGTNGATLFGSTNCASTSHIIWTWEFSNGVTGQFQSNGSQFQVPVPAPLGVNQVCFTAVVMNVNNEPTATSQQCFPINPNALGAVVNVIQNATGCGLNDGCITMNIVGGTPPYTWWMGGVNQSPSSAVPNNQICNLAPGLHYFVISDSGGCTTTQTFNVPSNPPQGISARVFNDLNGDGQPGTGVFTEPIVAGIPFYIVEADVTVYSGANGYFYLPNLPAGSYTIQYAGEPGTWSQTNPLTVTAPNCIQIPLQSSTPLFAQSSGVTGFFGNLHCQNGMNTGLWVANTGNTPFSGTITLTGPASLTYVGTNTGQTFSSQNGGVVTWNINNQPPGQQTNYLTHINGPGTAFIGQSFPITITIVLNDGDGNPFYTNTWTINPVVTCAYDPNDKLAMPEGYAEPHFVLADTEITYTIRFQNTGNAPAEDVWIEDPLDIAHLDISTFEPVAASHDYYTVLNPDGTLRFYFDNIMLPDSVNNEPESHGYVMYRISLRNDIQPGDVIHNEAAIYFDLNEPIITNQTWHTVYSCDWLVASSDELAYCYMDMIMVNDDTQYVEDYIWTWNGIPLSWSDDFSHYATPEGANALSLTLSNPLCEVTTDRLVIVNPVPEVTISVVDGDLVVYPEGLTYTWYLNDELIEEATGSILSDPTGGYYSVEVTDDNGCSAMAFTTVAGIALPEANRISLYPNPVTGESRLDIPEGIWNLVVTDGVGRAVWRKENIQGSQLIHASEVGSGYYLMRGFNRSGESWVMPFLVR